MKDSSFSQAVWRITKEIPLGKITTYAQIAQALGRPKSARAVGNALHKNPYAPIVPCHRVVKSDGNVGGFFGGKSAKKKILRSEGLKIVKDKIANFQSLIHTFKAKNNF